MFFRYLPKNRTMSDPTLTSFLEKNHFAQGDKPLKFIRKTEHGPLELLFQPLKRTKYAGEIRYREFVGCRVTFTMRLNVPSRFIVTDRDIAQNRFVVYLDKRKGRINLEGLRDDLLARVAEKEWSEHILYQEEVQEALGILFSTERQIRRQQSLTLDPMGLTYAYRMKSVDLEALDELIPAYLLVSEKVKQAGEPKVKLSATPLENLFVKHPYASAILILVGLMLLLAVPFIIIGLIFFIGK